MIQFVTVLSYKLHEKDAVFAMCKNSPNYLFTLKSPFLDSKRELNHSLRCTTYAMDYSEYYHGNVTDHTNLPEGSWALQVTSYVTNHASIWNNWLHSQLIENRNIFLRMISGNNFKKLMFISCSFYKIYNAQEYASYI